MMVDLVGIEPTTSSMPWKRAPSCATGPTYELWYRISIFAQSDPIVKRLALSKKRNSAYAVVSTHQYAAKRHSETIPRAVISVLGHNRLCANCTRRPSIRIRPGVLFFRDSTE